MVIVYYIITYVQRGSEWFSVLALAECDLVIPSIQLLFLFVFCPTIITFYFSTVTPPREGISAPDRSKAGAHEKQFAAAKARGPDLSILLYIRYNIVTALHTTV